MGGVDNACAELLFKGLTARRTFDPTLETVTVRTHIYLLEPP